MRIIAFVAITICSGSARSAPIHAGHGAPVLAVAITDDGKVAASSDAHGSLRLWPALDGTREPVVVAARAAKALAIARDREQLVIAGLDGVGQLELVRLSGSGEPVDRRVVTDARPIVAVHATSHGFLVVRDDLVIELVAFDGTSRGSLVTAPGEHLGTLAVRNDAALAVIDDGAHTRGRWLALGDTLAWGAATPRLPIRAERVALAPGHRKVAGIARDDARVAIVDLAHGQVLGYEDEYDHFGGIAPGDFFDDTQLGISFGSASGLVWRSDNGSPASLFGAAAFAAGRAVVADPASLAIAVPGERPHYLGYRTSTLRSVWPVRDGWLASSDGSIVRLDARLRERKTFDIPDGSRQIQLVDAGHALAAGYYDGKPRLLDLEDPGHPTVLPYELLAYEPSTGVIALSAYANRTTWLELGRYDRRRHAFGDFVSYTPGTSPYAVVLDPKRTHGMAALVIAGDQRSTIEVTEIRAIEPELVIGKTRKLAVTQDAYWTEFQRLSTGTPPTSTSPDGRHTLEIAGMRTTLRDSAGQPLWTIATPGALAWHPSGELYAYGAGMARIDLATGALRERQCGWQFGLWDDPGEAPAPQLCEQP